MLFYILAILALFEVAERVLPVLPLAIRVLVAILIARIYQQSQQRITGLKEDFQKMQALALFYHDQYHWLRSLLDTGFCDLLIRQLDTEPEQPSTQSLLYASDIEPTNVHQQLALVGVSHEDEFQAQSRRNIQLIGDITVATIQPAISILPCDALVPSQASTQLVLSLKASNDELLLMPPTATKRVRDNKYEDRPSKRLRIAAGDDNDLVVEYQKPHLAPIFFTPPKKHAQQQVAPRAPTYHFKASPEAWEVGHATKRAPPNDSEDRPSKRANMSTSGDFDLVVYHRLFERLLSDRNQPQQPPAQTLSIKKETEPEINHNASIVLGNREAAEAEAWIEDTAAKVEQREDAALYDMQDMLAAISSISLHQSPTNKATAKRSHRNIGDGIDKQVKKAMHTKQRRQKKAGRTSKPTPRTKALRSTPLVRFNVCYQKNRKAEHVAHEVERYLSEYFDYDLTALMSLSDDSDSDGDVDMPCISVLSLSDLDEEGDTEMF
ncbi:hypothetical protein M406DRAFT_70403 [Cryphonectria parasitica EP155]|uniref:Uncharacterized protein n=1 Tax=Cryphonectria parasitica (strain ATCC 38755 / EP155) TaxID=660469 RepID=A0A9P4Y168_CRYP1|nr:uncharacterized protein M406DRAFT_70403 [Cryphonectria parasitica EP155]KAF3765099.1 hypothetical protein M406DRAFT_70403 [Cryphonectria parasitica EP155]